MKVAVMVGMGVSVLGLIGGGYAYEKTLQSGTHQTMDDKRLASDVELDLQRIELELKLFRIIAERRGLTPDEQSRKDYLEAYRLILVGEQSKRVS